MSTSKQTKNAPNADSAGAQFWLVAFSQDGAWQKHVSEPDIALTLDLVTDEEVSAILGELSANGLEADSVLLANLLRHWARLALNERDVLPDNRDPKLVRTSAKKLRSVLAKLDELLKDDSSGLGYPISQHLDQEFPIHRSYERLRSLTSITAELLPAVGKLATVISEAETVG